MNIRIDSKHSTNDFFIIDVDEEETEFTIIRRGYIKSVRYTCKTADLIQALKKVTSLEIEQFSEVAGKTSEEVWNSLFLELAPKHLDWGVSDRTSHKYAYYGFVNNWLLSTQTSQKIRLSVELYDPAFGKTTFSGCVHEVDVDSSRLILGSVGAPNMEALNRMAEDFSESDWKTLHDTFPSANACTWLSEMRP
jgi:hypothetical protein